MPTLPATIPAIATPPSISNPSNFDTLADASWNSLPAAIAGMNAAGTVAYNNAVESGNNATAAAASKAAAATSESNAAQSAASAVNAPGTSATSTTSLAMALGPQTLTIQTAKSIVAGMQVLIANTTAPTQYMRGTVTAYNSGTGSLTVNVDYMLGSGTIATWTVSLTGVFVNPAASQAAAAASTLNTLYGAL